MAVFSILENLSQTFPLAVLRTHSDFGDLTAVIKKESILEVMEFLKTNPDLHFDVLMDLSAVDYLWLGKNPRFEVVYHLFSMDKKHRLRVKVGIEDGDLAVDSVTSLWGSADWFEREVWDLFGIRFRGHPNLKRILMYEGFAGHPLRKDYPYNKRQPLIGPRN